MTKRIAISPAARALLAVLLSMVFCVSPRAQVATGPAVKEIAVEYDGPPAISKERVLANLATQVGQPYSERAAEQDIRALYATGGISNVRMFAEPQGEGVKVTVLIRGLPAIEEVIIEGAEQIKLARVKSEISTKVGGPLSEERIEDDRQKILKLYEDRNFAEVQVRTSTKELGGKKGVRVVFSISEGPKLIVRRVNFTGNYAVLPKDLLKVMKTRPYNILSFLNKSGKLLPAQIDEDKSAIRSLYQNRGFADVAITDFNTVPLGKDGVEVNIAINEGIQYKINSLKLEGVNVAPADQVKRELKMIEGSLYTPKGMTADLKALRNFYGSRGYVDMAAVPEVYPSGQGQVDLIYRVEEGVQSYVNLINIQGNNRTKDKVIRRELSIKPGNIFDTTKMDVSRERLMNLNYFSKVDMAPADTLVPGRKDLNVIVEEKRTGSFNFGAGFSTTDSLVGFAELQQTNFDLFNWPNFTGGGQRFRIRAQYGIERQDFVASLTEPWFLGYKLSVGVEGFYRSATFLSTVYTQANYGVAFQARKSLWRALSGRAEYRIENVDIYDIQSGAGLVIQDSAGLYTKSSITGALTWDTRDSLFLTRKGEQITLTGFVAGGGLGGTVQDYGISLEAAKYWSLPFDCIFIARGEVAITDGWGGSQNTSSYGQGVPIFDRLYLGGANNLRGFDFREVGPKDINGNPIGGNSLAFATLELTFPIMPRIRGAIFTDWGFVNADANDFSTSNLNGDMGIGARVELPIGPVRIDFGYPVKTDQWNGSSGKVNFNIGYQF